MENSLSSLGLSMRLHVCGDRRASWFVRESCFQRNSSLVRPGSSFGALQLRFKCLVVALAVKDDKRTSLDKPISVSFVEEEEPNSEVTSALQSCGMSRAQVLSIVRKKPQITEVSPEKIVENLVYLVSIGCQANDIAQAGTRNISWFTASIQELSDLVEFLVLNGVDRQRVPGIMLQCAFLLGEKPSLKERPSEGLQCILNEEDVLKIIESRPKVLGLTSHGIMESVNIMRHFVPEDQIPPIVLKQPFTLLVSQPELASRFEELAKIFHPHKLPNALQVAPALLRLDAVSLREKFVILETYLTPEAASKLVNSFPQTLTLDWENILLPKFQYLDSLGLDRFEVMKFPAYLGYSLRSRILPRSQALLKSGYEIKPHKEVIPYFREKKLHVSGLTHYEALQQYGGHKICIQHYVGLRDEVFEERFRVSKIIGQLH